MEETLTTITEKLALETTSYGALQYLQSFVARKKKAIGVDATSQAIFHGCSLLIARGDSEDAGHALSWYVDAEDLFHVSGHNGNKKGTHCDVERLLALMNKFTSKQMVGCVSVLYDPFHAAVLKSGMTTGRNTDSAVSQRMLTFDNKCADIFEDTESYRSAYRVCIRLNLVPRAAGILDKWSNLPGVLLHEKALFFARAIYSLLAEKKLPLAVQLVAASKTILSPLDNISASDVRPGGNDSGYIACWHLSIILTELVDLAPGPRINKIKLFEVLSALYYGILDLCDRNLVALHEKVGKEYFTSPDNKKVADPMNMLQAILSGAGGGGGQKKQGPGTLGGMDINEMMAMLNKMGK